MWLTSVITVEVEAPSVGKKVTQDVLKVHNEVFRTVSVKQSIYIS